MWVYLIMGFTFIAIGFAVHILKWHFLISGYNTMSKEKKSNVDAEGLGRLMGLYSYANGGVYIATGLLHKLGFKLALVRAIIFTIISTIYLIIKAQKYDRNKVNSKQIVIGIVILVVTSIFVAGLMYSSMKPTKVIFHEEGLEIGGMYGDIYPWDSIEEVMIIEELPTVKMRTNGSALGTYLKGYFSTEEMGSVKLHVNTQYPPYIFLETDGRTIIFNMNKAKDTQEILDGILLRIK
ncbi:MAG: DUF3784 domain-containing protein [Tissierellaceae bacterium]|nr:DUF3784 domain-containing protein [Tissierellaceae bacterium]